MGERSAWVTLATNDSYCLGALVLAHSLKRAATRHELVILITPGVTPVMKERLGSVFSQVVCVDVLDSGDAAHLALLARPELGITFTKLHCWTLTQYSKCVFLDADTLVLQNCDELFEREELSAAPDVGWPDCFNSGVFVYRPSNETFNSLINFAKEKGSFDGGDQGLLNQYFSSWAHGDISKHLPFLYNVCSTAFYSYLPALKQYGSNTKIIHFIGNMKPWLQTFNWGSRSVSDSGHMQAPLQHWWDLFLDAVHPTLNVAMARWECDAADSAALYAPPSNLQSPFPWHHPAAPPAPAAPRPHPADFHDPWEHFCPRPPSPPAPLVSPPQPIPPEQPAPSNCDPYLSDRAQNDSTPDHSTPKEIEYRPKPWYESYIPQKDEEQHQPEEWYDVPSHPENVNLCGPGGSQCGTSIDNLSEYFSSEYEHREWQNLENVVNDESECNEDDDYCLEIHSIPENDNCTDQKKQHIEEVRVRHPYDNYYLLHRTILESGCKRCSHEEPPAPSPSPPPPEEPEPQAGVAGALSQLTLGAAQQPPAVEDHMRRQGWEAGNMDYMGADSFNNIWAKISETLASPASPAESAPPVVTAPPAEPTLPAHVPTPPSTPETPLPKVPSEALSTVSGDSWEQVPKDVTPVKSELESSGDSLLSLDSSTSPSSAASSASPPSSNTSTSQQSQASPADQEPQATTEDIQDSKRDIEEAPLAIPVLKPKEKLVCHLKPTVDIDQSLTPDNEHEDAASIALSIIASEEALTSPVITSATPPVSSPVCPAIPQNMRDLTVDTTIPETPPVLAPVSLAQIGIVIPKPGEVASTIPSDISDKSEKTISDVISDKSITTKLADIISDNTSEQTISPALSTVAPAIEEKLITDNAPLDELAILPILKPDIISDSIISEELPKQPTCTAVVLATKQEQLIPEQCAATPTDALTPTILQDIMPDSFVQEELSSTVTPVPIVKDSVVEVAPSVEDAVEQLSAVCAQVMSVCDNVEKIITKPPEISSLVKKPSEVCKKSEEPASNSVSSVPEELPLTLKVNLDTSKEAPQEITSIICGEHPAKDSVQESVPKDIDIPPKKIVIKKKELVTPVAEKEDPLTEAKPKVKRLVKKPLPPTPQSSVEGEAPVPPPRKKEKKPKEKK